jgi:hypothetical protein
VAMTKKKDDSKKGHLRELCLAHTEIEGYIAERKNKSENKVMEEILAKALREVTELTIQETKKLNDAAANK